MAVEIQYVERKTPEALLKCADWPMPPDPAAGQDKDSDSVEYQERGRAAYADCAAKLDGEWWRQYGTEPTP